MGCCHAIPASAHAFTAEESACLEAEVSLGYGKHKVTYIAQVIKANCSDTKVSESQYNTIAETLQLNIAESDTIDSPMFQFHRGLRSKGFLSAPKLLVLAGLLGTGTPEEKVQAYFAAMPGLQDECATPISVAWLLDTLFSISLKHLPLLVRKEKILPNGGFSDERFSLYLSKLSASGNKAKTVALATILKGSSKVTAQDMATAFDGSSLLGKFLRPQDIRTYALLPDFM